MAKKLDGEIFAKRLKALRLERGMTQDQLAIITNTSRPAIGHYEYNQRQPRFDTLQRMAIYFNVSIDYMIGITDVRNEDEAIHVLIDKLKTTGFIKNDSITIKEVENMIDSIVTFKEFSQKIRLPSNA